MITPKMTIINFHEAYESWLMFAQVNESWLYFLKVDLGSKIKTINMNMYLKNTSINEFFYLILSELLTNIDKFCISPWHTLQH